MVRVGVLALQGGFEAHTKALKGLGAEVVEVRRIAALETLDGLVLPGGETTTLLNLMRDEAWFEELRAFHARGGALWGTCAGAILLSSGVVDPAQPALELLDATIARNAYGRQVDSFEADLTVRGLDDPFHAVFIRAPKFRELGSKVQVLARYADEPVLVRQGRVLACTFHPELTRDDRLHRLFMEILNTRAEDEAYTPADSEPRRVMAR